MWSYDWYNWYITQFSRTFSAHRYNKSCNEGAVWTLFNDYRWTWRKEGKKEKKGGKRRCIWTSKGENEAEGACIYSECVQYLCVIHLIYIYIYIYIYTHIYIHIRIGVLRLFEDERNRFSSKARRNQVL